MHLGWVKVVVFLKLRIAGNDRGVLPANDVTDPAHEPLEFVQAGVWREADRTSIRSASDGRPECCAWGSGEAIAFAGKEIVLLHPPCDVSGSEQTEARRASCNIDSECKPQGSWTTGTSDPIS